MTSGPRDYRFLRRPTWIAFTALVLFLVVVMINLALWQLRRLDERRDRNDRVAAALAAAPVPIGDGGDVAEWTTVSATGTFDPSRQVLIRNRSYRGQPGYHVVTPLERADGTALLVNRGWVPLEADAGQLEVPPPPAGEVTVIGHVRPSQRRGRFFSPSDPAAGRLDQLYRVDVPRIAEQVPYPLLPVYVELISVDPPLEEVGGTGATVTLPIPVPPPEQDDGPHLAYAGQWVLFSACAVGGWIIVVRRRARAGPATVTT